jgi:hypothetical protein
MPIGASEASGWRERLAEVMEALANTERSTVAFQGERVF